MKRYQVRVDLWIDAPDREAVRHRVGRVLDRLVAQGLGALDFLGELPLYLSHWKLRRLRYVPPLGAEYESEDDINEDDDE